ncbi:hypothetical protein I4U23_004660 [Adineta vaga]|nr:hypothetical protein I4U23_004660 [Adineta vaga]
MMQVAIGSAGSVTPSQVVQLLKYLSSDDDKLQMAKMAYGYVFLSDHDSYDRIVGNGFSSKIEADYVDGKNDSTSIYAN